MKYRNLQVVILAKDVPEHGLQRGDVGTIVETYEPDGLEIEFVTASGDTEALVTVTAKDVRAADRNDMLTVRPSRRSGCAARD